MGQTLPEMLALIKQVRQYPADWTGNQVLAKANEDYAIVPPVNAAPASKANAIIAMMRVMGDI